MNRKTTSQMRTELLKAAGLDWRRLLDAATICGPATGKLQEWLDTMMFSVPAELVRLALAEADVARLYVSTPADQGGAQEDEK